MAASLTLNKITAQKGISIGEAANRVADLGWTPSYVQEAMTFPTDYKISRVPRDPMKQVLRSYFPMQEEKDNRVYGALDAALRGDMFRNVEPRWIEWMKLFLAIIPFPEISAARSMAMVGRLAPGEELRTGFTMQMVDELRHSTIQMNLKKWYMENRPGRLRHHGGRLWQVLRIDHRASVRRGLPDRRRHHRGEHLLDGRGRDGIHEHAVRRDAVGSGAQRRLRPADGVLVGAVRRIASHRQRPLVVDGDDPRSVEP